MSADTTQPVTRLLARLSAGDARAAEELFPLVYGELHALAASLFGPRAGHTLQPTALVHEVWLKLAGAGPESAEWASRAHFFGVAARAMRSVLVDHARAKQAAKRGGGAERLELDEIAAVFAEEVPDLLALDEALTRLEAMDAELARLVELRFFAGLTIEDAARTLAISVPTAVRAWQVARLWLARELG